MSDHDRLSAAQALLLLESDNTTYPPPGSVPLYRTENSSFAIDHAPQMEQPPLDIPSTSAPDLSFRKRWQRLNRKLEMARRASGLNTTTLEDCNEAELALRKALDELECAAEECDFPDLEDTLKKANDDCSESIAMLSRSLQQLTRGPSSNVSDSSFHSSAAVRSAQCQLSKFSTPKFSGEVRTYMAFKAKFKLLVERNQPSEFALLRLQEESLKRDSIAYHLVAGKQTISEAWEALDQHFGRANTIRDAVLRDIRSIPPVKSAGDSKALRNLVTALASARSDLKACGQESALGDSALSHLMTKIPFSLREKIDNKAIDDGLTNDEHIDFFIRDRKSVV